MTKIWAHRGASIERPENSMSAFKRAHELSSAGIELDIYLLPDGNLIVHHDHNLGVHENKERYITDYNVKTIKNLDIAKKFSEEFGPERIPLLSEVLEWMKDTDMYLNAEIKSPDGFISDVGIKTAEMIIEYGMQDRTIISCFLHHFLKDIKQKYPNIKTGILYVKAHGIDIVKYCLDNGFDAIHPLFVNLDKNTVDRCHENGIDVNVWTVDGKEDILRMKEFGVDSIITNDPAKAIPLMLS